MKYDLHIHTKYSKCSNLSPKVVLRKAKKKGLNGIAITDHNTIKGALEVSKLNKDKDFEVIVGEEIDTDKGEILGLYLKKEIKPGKFMDVIDEIHKQGGIAVAAHPFAIGIIGRRGAGKGACEKVDAIEGMNSRSFFRFENLKAQIRAKELAKPITAGSDSHFKFEIGRAYVEFDGDLKKALKQRKTKVYGSNKYGFLARFLTGLYKWFFRHFKKNR